MVIVHKFLGFIYGLYEKGEWDCVDWFLILYSLKHFFVSDISSFVVFVPSFFFYAPSFFFVCLDTLYKTSLKVVTSPS